MRLSLLILFLASSSFLFSQDSLLKKFKYRIDHYQAIAYNIGGGGFINNTNLSAGENNNQGTGGNLGASYSFIRSTDRVLLNFAGGFSSNFSNNKTNGNTTNNGKYKSAGLNPYLNISNRWFGKKLFVELGTESYAYLSHNKSILTTPTATEGKNRQGSYRVAINTGIGKGRLENITDMQNALWLYKALLKENKLSRSLTGDELYGLGRSITKANNTRVLDARKRIQFILETTDSFFMDKNVIPVSDIRYFSTLNDILFYAINNVRYAGTEKFIRFTPSLNIQSNYYDNKNPSYGSDNRDVIKSARISIGINRYVPFNLMHQNNFGFAVYGNYTEWNEVDKSFTGGVLTGRTEINSSIKQAGVNLFFLHAIYPNTRTIINFNLRGDGGYQAIGNTETFYGITELSCLLDYFISYRTKITGGLGIAYQKNVYDYTNNISLLPERFLLNTNIGLVVNM
jgi:hypothetical protein